MVIEKIPKKEILHFLPISEFGVKRVADYYSRCDYHICEYSLGIKLMWEQMYRYRFSEACGCLICRDEYDGVVYFDFPVAGEDYNIGGALEKIEEYCLETDTPLRFTTVPSEFLGGISSRYDGVEIQNTYQCRDYIYRTDDVMLFEGKRFAGQRNHIRRFERNYPEAVFRPMTRDDLPALDRFIVRFNEGFDKQGTEAMTERESAFQILHMDDCADFRIGCMEYRGEIIGIALGEKCGDSLVEHIEKALASEYEGIYPALLQAFVRAFGSDCTYVNREDDASDRGLRTSKMQYHPCMIVPKYDITVKNVAHFIGAIPTLTTERLTMDAIKATDSAAYGALCLDDERNRYWGYDYRTDFSDRTPKGSDFCRIASEDFDVRYAINFAVRLDGAMIGEVVLYRFDCLGGAEIGVRILPQYAGKGFGKEAFSAVSDWALYRLGLTTLRAQCFRENKASEHLLSSLMRRNGENERMLFFVRTI